MTNKDDKAGRIGDVVFTSLSAIVCVLFVVAVGHGTRHAYAKRAQETTRRELLARMWLSENEIEGHVTCEKEEITCIIVPKEPRPIIQLLCYTETDLPGCKVRQ